MDVVALDTQTYIINNLFALIQYIKAEYTIFSHSYSF